MQQQPTYRKYWGWWVLCFLITGFISLGCLGLFIFFSVETQTITKTYYDCNCTCFTEKWVSSGQAFEKNITVDDIEEFCGHWHIRGSNINFCEISYVDCSERPTNTSCKDQANYYHFDSLSKPGWANACQFSFEVDEVEGDLFGLSVFFGCIALIYCCCCFALVGCEITNEELEKNETEDV